MDLKKVWESTIWMGSAVAVGGLSGLLIREGVRNFQETVEKPALMPPTWLFPVAWAILYLLMGFSAARVHRHGKSESLLALAVYWTQLGVNFCWSLLFFNRGVYLFSFGWLVGLWVLIVAMIWLFWKVDRVAALLQLPYLAWTTFAGYLNYSVWILNR